MTRMSPADWVQAVRSARSAPELLGFLCRRLAQPYDEGPPLDDRGGEGAEEIFEEIAHEDDGFRLRLEEAIATYFKSADADPARADAQPVILGMLDIVSRLSLTGAFSPLRAWLAQHEAALRDEPTALLGRAVLEALATSQPVGLTDVRDFWRRWWRNGPPAWQPCAFIGLRLQDPPSAAEELSLLIERATALRQDPGPLLQGMWAQPGDARPAFLSWLNAPDNPWAEQARGALRRRVTEADLPLLNKPLPLSKPLRRAARLLAAPGCSDNWLRKTA